MGAHSLDVLLARDISVSGVGVYVPHRFEGCDLDAEVDLVITLPHARAFLAKGLIKHVTRADEPSAFFGVEFTQLADANRRQLQTYVADLERHAARATPKIRSA